METLTDLSTALRRALWFLVVVGIADFFADLLQLSVLLDLQAGRFVDETFATTVETAALTTATARLAALLFALVVFLRWFARAHRNLGVASLEELNFSPRWAIASCLIPIVNFLLPYIVMKEVWAGSAALAQAPRGNWRTIQPPQDVKTWWAACVIAMLLARNASRFYVKAGLEEAIAPSIASLFDNPAQIAAALLTMKIVASVTRLQEQALQETTPSGA